MLMRSTAHAVDRPAASFLFLHICAPPCGTHVLLAPPTACMMLVAVMRQEARW